jgi:2-polyprenyl-6-methoxyphenol hydroxylase-like FAD-dependent oxidoreductase
MSTRIETSCCITGGGPAGVMLGFLLARMGVDVWVLEKHGDFLRDFRGDTIHPSTLQVLHELGILDEFLERPHQETLELAGMIGKETTVIADFSHLPTRCKFIAFMPQWEFLNFLAEKARQYPSFHLEMQAEVTGLIEEDGRIVGVRATTGSDDVEIRAGLTVGADGRHSIVREGAHMERLILGAPMDILWMRLSRKSESNNYGQSLGRIDTGRMLALINRNDYWQIGYVISKGAADEMRSKDIAPFREELVRLAPFLRDQVHELRSWDDVKLLTVAVDRLTRWSRPGLLCIGDAAHAMSPIGGVGINLAIQDAVATANLLGAKLLKGIPSESDLDAVQRRRMFPTRATQWIQITAQNNVIKKILASTKPITLPWPLKLTKKFPRLRRIPARVIGMGFRPEHVKTPELRQQSQQQKTKASVSRAAGA